MFKVPLYLVSFFLILTVGYLVLIDSCKKDIAEVGNGYPEAISKIIVGKCATAGCHNRENKDAAAGLSLQTWDDMFAGDHNGAVCIPYSHAYSTIFLYTNTDPSLGTVNPPTMPFNQPPLSSAEIKTLINWIDAGAPNANGKIMWADNPKRKKFYVSNQGCDVVTVFDEATLLQMRYINVGAGGAGVSPHMIKISPDGNYWYPCFYTGSYLQKFKTSDDSYVGQAYIGPGSWNTLAISPDSKYAYVVNWSSSSEGASVAPVNLNTMTSLGAWSGIFDYPHGSLISSKGDTLYITCNSGNFIYEIPVTNPGNERCVSLDQSPVVTEVSCSDPANVQPHDIAWNSDSTIYFVTCDSAKCVRALLRRNDSLIASIPTGVFPQELAVSYNPNTPYIFVSCMYDPATSPQNNRGSITVINYKTLTQVANLKSFNIAEPHGIAVDDNNGLVYVANRNIDGPLPHHTTVCGGRTGFVSFINMNTLTVLSNQIEVASDPYSVAVRK